MPKKRFDNCQCGRVMKYIECFGGITRADAMQELGIANLPAVISNLRQDGAEIITEDVHARNRWGEKITYARYVLPKKEEK